MTSAYSIFFVLMEQMTTHLHPSDQEKLCPVCDGTASNKTFPFDFEWDGRAFSFFRCSCCKSAFIQPMLCEEDLKKIYTWDTYHQKHYPKLGKNRNRKSLEILKSIYPSAKSLLEFGCGNGNYLIEAKDMGFSCCGAEISPSVAQSAEKLTGLKVYNLNTLLESKQKFDVIHLHDVYHHLPNPKAVLETLERLLEPSGVLYLEGPMEDNASLVHMVARLLRKGQRMLGLDSIRKVTPTMLFRTHVKSQEFFFQKQMGWESLYFEVYETGWPYITPLGVTLTPRRLMKRIVGYTAIGLSKICQTLGWRLGNRFRGVYRPVGIQR